MTGPRIGSLFSGTGALDLAVMDVFGGHVVWHSQYEPPDKNGREDKNQYAARILARHWPDTPNLGDVTAIDWQTVLAEHGPVDILTGGFPCQDVSSAGKRAGLTADSRSGLWAHFARAIHELRPRLVVIENVEGLLSAEADRGLESGAEVVDQDAGAGGVLRAVGAVLGDLATLGFHAEWARVAASEVGAPHPRKRVFIYAWPADADAADLGHERGGSSRRRGRGPTDGGVSTADTSGDSGRFGDGDDVRAGSRADGRFEAAGRGEAAADAERVGRQGERGDAAADAERQAPARVGCGSPGGCEAPADPPSLGRGEGRAESAWEQGRSDAAERGGTPSADADDFGRRADVLQLRPGKPDLDWGDYGPAIRRWAAVIGRPAPWPTDALGRLSPVFTEWMMGLPDGWVTCTPGLTRSAMLRALGNGVVRLQGAVTIRFLHARSQRSDFAAAA